MKDKKSTKTSVDRGRSIYTILKENITDKYFLDVLYYYIRRALIRMDFNLEDISGIKFNGRFMGHELNVDFITDYNTVLKSLGLLMSIRVFMIDHKYLYKCYNEEFLFNDFDLNFLKWDGHRAIIDCLEDEEFRFIYNMVLYQKENHKLSDELIAQFKANTVRPEYRNLIIFCRMKAADPDYNGKSIIKNNAYLYADFNSFTIPENVDYIGDTAFAYCKNLETLIISQKVYFGYFPIVECNNLKQIIVPTDLIDYYKECLPYYKNIIADKEIIYQDNTQEKPEENNDEAKGIPNTEKELPQQENKIEKIHVQNKVSIDIKTLEHIFDKKATSYKYFWFLSIISLAKEREVLTIPFKDITIRMAALAWPIVFDYEIDLRDIDMLPKYLESITKKTSLIKAASSKVVDTYLTQHYNSQGIDKILAPLLKNVPYRFLSPWIPYTTDEEVIEKSNSDDCACLYALHENAVVLDEDWWDYISSNYSKICDFVKDSFISYTEPNNNKMKYLSLMTNGWSLV